MPKFMIERDMPGAGALSPSQLAAAAQTSCDVIRQMGPGIEWVESFVTRDKVYCIYIAQDEDLIREHAALGGFPANLITPICSVINPSTADS